MRKKAAMSTVTTRCHCFLWKSNITHHLQQRAAFKNHQIYGEKQTWARLHTQLDQLAVLVCCSRFRHSPDAPRLSARSCVLVAITSEWQWVWREAVTQSLQTGCGVQSQGRFYVSPGINFPVMHLSSFLMWFLHVATNDAFYKSTDKTPNAAIVDGQRLCDWRNSSNDPTHQAEALFCIQVRANGETSEALTC